MFALQASHHPSSQGKNMARQHPYKNSLGTFCFCVLLLSCAAAPGQGQENGRKILKKAPMGYPYILKSKGIGGVVKLKVFVKPDGTVRDTEVVGGNPILAESAQKSVMQWKFSPGSSETALEVSVTFDPRSDSGS
jgi:TonB family protein